MKIDYNKIIDRYYESGSCLREVLIRHSRQVAAKALDIARRKNLGIAEDDIIAAAMLHDIGICHTDAPGIHCHGELPYICHGVAGSQMLSECGCPEWLCAIARTHTGAGLSPDDIKSQNLPLPPGDYMPHTLLEKLICYADKFFSKSGDMEEKPLEKVRASLSRHGEDTLRRFDAMHALFA